MSDERGADSTAGGARSLDDLYSRPGFLLRRAHQISVALFLEDAAGLGITATQYGTMYVLRARGSLDQVGIATLLGIDRSTTALVVKKLEDAGYIARLNDPIDKRRKIITLAKAGHEMLERASGPAQRARQRALDAFSTKDAAKFLSLLGRFVDAFNELTRAPIRAIDDMPPVKRKKR